MNTQVTLTADTNTQVTLTVTQINTQVTLTVTLIGNTCTQVTLAMLTVTVTGDTGSTKSSTNRDMHIHVCSTKRRYTQVTVTLTGYMHTHTCRWGNSNTDQGTCTCR